MIDESDWKQERVLLDRRINDILESSETTIDVYQRFHCLVLNLNPKWLNSEHATEFIMKAFSAGFRSAAKKWKILPPIPSDLRSTDYERVMVTSNGE